LPAPPPAPAIAATPSEPLAPTTVVDLHPALAPLAWMVGHARQGDAGNTTSEHWIAAGKALWGIGLTVRGGVTATFEILLIDADERGGLRLTAIPGGTRTVVFPLSSRAERTATFENPRHDAPKTITYARTAEDRLVARLDDAAGARPPILDADRVAITRAGALEAADRAFAADVAARGIEGWVAAFAADGMVWRAEGTLRGHDAIRKDMAPLLSDPDARLTWEPVTSVMSPAGDLGFTVGRSRLLRRGHGGQMEERARFTYVTLWRRQAWRQQAGGAWKVLWDGGHAE
jgi:ketosteroid isomerase-like protein